MAEKCLILVDDSIINKLYYFLVDYCSITTNDTGKMINLFMGNKNDYEVEKRMSLLELRKSLVPRIHTPLTEIDLDSIISQYLYYLRTYNTAVSQYLSYFLDAIMEYGEEGYRLSSIKRLTGIFAAIFEMYYINHIKLDSTVNLSDALKRAFSKSYDCYCKEDINFLFQLFFMKDALIILK
jgi:hypothetical protein